MYRHYVEIGDCLLFLFYALAPLYEVNSFYNKLIYLIGFNNVTI